MTIDAYGCGRWTAFTGDRPLDLPTQDSGGKKKCITKGSFSPGFVWGEPKELHPTKLEVFFLTDFFGVWLIVIV